MIYSWGVLSVITGGLVYGLMCTFSVRVSRSLFNTAPVRTPFWRPMWLYHYLQGKLSLGETLLRGSMVTGCLIWVSLALLGGDTATAVGGGGVVLTVIWLWGLMLALWHLGRRSDRGVLTRIVAALFIGGLLQAGAGIVIAYSDLPREGEVPSDIQKVIFLRSGRF